MASKAIIDGPALMFGGCTSGRHRPRRVAIGASGGLASTTCRDCGGRLVRTLATRQWVYSGELA